MTDQLEQTKATIVPDANGFIDWEQPADAGWFHLTGPMDLINAGNLTAAMLNWLKDNQKPGNYVIYVNCTGGYVHDAIAVREIINLVRRKKHKVIAVVLRSASCSNIVATAADEVYMGENSWWMVHEVKSGIFDSEAEKIAEEAFRQRLNAQTMDLMASPQLKPADLQAMVTKETTVWFNAKQCWEHGLINGILKEPAIDVRRAV
jgi:ATP-dependent protease ClpP protease subunit